MRTSILFAIVFVVALLSSCEPSPYRKVSKEFMYRVDEDVRLVSEKEQEVEVSQQKLLECRKDKRALCEGETQEVTEAILSLRYAIRKLSDDFRDLYDSGPSDDTTY